MGSNIILAFQYIVIIISMNIIIYIINHKVIIRVTSMVMSIVYSYNIFTRTGPILYAGNYQWEPPAGDLSILG